jgi:FkbM family methyltransferase
MSRLIERLLDAGSAVRTSLRLAVLGGSPVRAARTLAACLVVCVGAPALRRAGRTVTVHVGEVDFHVDHVTDLHVLREVWDARIYDTEVPDEPRVVLDVGANIGATVAFFKRRWPSCVVHGFEPDPGAFAKLSRNVGQLDGVVLHQMAVGAENGDVTLWSSAAAWTSSTLGPLGRGARPVRVAQRTLTAAIDLARADRVDLLKVDAEGAEFVLLPQAGREPRVQAIIGELHFDLAPEATVEDVLAALPGFDVEFSGDAARRMDMTARRRAPAQ